MNCVDVFPSEISPTLSVISTQLDDWISQATAYVSKIEASGDCLVTFEKESDVPSTEKHLKTILRESQKKGDNHIKTVFWDKIQQRLYNTSNRKLKNVNVRTFYKCQECMFLVKYAFTFGHRKVATDTFHVYQMTEKPMLFYHLPQEYASHEFPPCLTERSFKRLDKPYYKTYILYPRQTYIVPENTRYLILAVQKTLFSLNIVRKTFPTENYLLFNGHKCSPIYQSNANQVLPSSSAMLSPIPRSLPISSSKKLVRKMKTAQSQVEEPHLYEMNDICDNKRKANALLGYTIPRKRPSN